MNVGDGRTDVCMGRKGCKEVTEKGASVPSKLDSPWTVQSWLVVKYLVLEKDERDFFSSIHIWPAFPPLHSDMVAKRTGFRQF